ncbi:MAG: P-loop NTPase family protein [Microcoleus sp. PH2017_29_MFU_D_A]|jgi:cob(I)alamin adenosyltransferase|uniref:P-loop NTPase family protein n=1 Tax=unclassified Microcoleus TaxID=2642155 RepID=UPI001DA412E1|nr:MULTISPECIES: P-loop NTPase family protein [unclassified Microcoleus]MCC3419736.1 P-loop NTPase family protein [Microcoleus sp. PH2017_07_MST_O_A]MCC3429484.1 P-loop NTPase family protein [Microcoleus sp. PH2017_04_SCI_O_A]MCC3443036.1 P-loop NTPase family protein [Microcoleus sp. PH2017_03_ELD_O_A]MCC3469328.1 P-loop NTPase family protein [Microcoleus sp. PH2017_06_SFM_O_A]MCC3506905.1 P-loop NTPase family protein [Microcoleus sp. PH2017_19_SFW_U_A]MCC3510834.1 P-loop NTPase family protei
MVAQLQTPKLNLTHSLPYTVKGLVQVFTGPHRCFFTNVMAQALRIAGQGSPVLAVQFLKGGINQGHQHPVRLGQNLDWVRCDLPRCIENADLDEIETRSIAQLWEYVQNAVLSGSYALVILDELSLAVNLGLIRETEVLALIDNKPHDLDIILTGPSMPPAILDVADQVTEIRRS